MASLFTTNSKRRFGVIRLLKRRRLAVISAAALAAYLAAAYFVLSPELPAVWQRLLGFGCAVLAAFTFVSATRYVESPDEMLRRMQMGRHSDFGKLRRAEQSKPRVVELPVFGQTKLHTLCGAGIFVLVCAWWLSPLAPIRVGKAEVKDLTIPLGEQLVAAVLILPNGGTTVVQMPILPAHIRQLATLIDDDKADSYHKGLKAMARGRFNEAGVLLAVAMRNKETEPSEIQLAQALGDMYAGRFAVAAAGYAKVLEHKPDDPLLLCQAAVAWMHAGRFERARPLLERAVKIGEKVLPKDDPARAAALHVQAVLNTCLGYGYDKSELLCLRSREIIAKKAVVEKNPFAAALIAASLNNQSVLYTLSAKNAGAVELNRGACQKWRDTLGPHDPLTAAALGNLAMIYYNQGRYAEADERLKEAVAVRSESLPDEHPLMAISYSTQAVIQRAQGRYDEALASAENALRMAEKTVGPEDPIMIPVLDVLGAAYVDRALFSKAEPLYLRAVAVAKKVCGPRHPNTAVVFNHLARLYIVTGRLDDAQTAAEEAMGIFSDAFGRQHPGVADALSLRGEIEIAQGRPRDARPYLEEVLKIREVVLGKDHIDVVRSLGAMAALDNSPRTYNRGVTGYKQAIDALEKRLGAEHPEIARLYYDLAALYVHRGKHTEAQPCLARALVIQEKSLVPFHPELAEVLEAYAVVLRSSNPPKSDRADAMLARAKSIRRKHAEQDRPQ